MSNAEKRYRELWCAVWCCPLDEYEADQYDSAGSHRNVIAEAESQAAAVVRLRERINHAIAKAKPYLHPGVNAGDHKVLSEVVSILEGEGG